MTNIRFRRGNKADLPDLAPSGLPLWCEDTKELYIGTDSGVSPVVTNNNYFPNFVPYCLNSGNQDSNGYADIINKVSNTEVSFKVGGSYPNIGVTFPNGNHYTISSIPNLINLTENGTYIFIIEEEGLVKLADGNYSAIATAVKLAYSANEVSPAMTSNTQNGFTCWMENDYNPGVPLNVPTAYYLMDKNTGTSVTFVEGDQGNSYSFIVKSDIAIKINRVQIEGPGNFGLGGNSLVSIFGSNNGINWTSITSVSSTAITDITNESYYTYYKFKPNINLVGGYSQYSTWLNNINFWYPVNYSGGNISEGYTYPESGDVSIVPAMTSNSSGGWTASAQSESTGAEAYKAVDGSVAANNRFYSSLNGVCWWKTAKNSGTFNCSRVSIKACEDYYASAPKDFTIRDQADNSLAILTNQIFSADETKYYDINATGISGIKIDTTATANNASVAFKEIKLYTSVSSADGDYHLLIIKFHIKHKKELIVLG